MTQSLPDVEALIERLEAIALYQAGADGGSIESLAAWKAAQALRTQDGLLREALEVVRPFLEHGANYDAAAPDSVLIPATIALGHFRRAAAFSKKLSAKDTPSTPQVSSTPHSAGSGSEG